MSKIAQQFETLSYSHYFHQIKNPESVELIVGLLGERNKNLKLDDLEELKHILPETDKNLFLMFRD